MARPGIILYGYDPSDEVRFGCFRPVMTLKTVVSMIKEMQPGQCASYGRRFTAEKPTKVATLCTGYADGYPRVAPSGTPVLVDGVRTTTVGRVSMDMLAVDLTPCPQAGIGAPVELWGKEIKIDDVAASSGTVGYELMCALAPRVPVVTL